MGLNYANRAIYLNTSFKFGLWIGETQPTEFFGPINFTQMALTAQAQENDELLSNMEGSAGEALASVPRPTEPAQLSAEFNTMTDNLLALLIGADTAELNQSTGAVEDDPITAAEGVWVPLANQHLAADSVGTQIVAKTAADATIAASHYEIDLINGLFRALTATGATVTKVSYHKAARTGNIFHAGKAASGYVKLVGTGTDRVSQKRHRIVIHKGSLAPTGEFDLAAGGFLAGALNGSLITPAGMTSPWQWEHLDLAA